jgi:hypothetical protein
MNEQAGPSVDHARVCCRPSSCVVHHALCNCYILCSTVFFKRYSLSSLIISLIYTLPCCRSHVQTGTWQNTSLPSGYSHLATIDNMDFIVFFCCISYLTCFLLAGSWMILVVHSVWEVLAVVFGT